jgi:hypothetical protein
MIYFNTHQVTLDHLEQFIETADHLNTRLLPIWFTLMPLQPGWPPRAPGAVSNENRR